MNPGPLEILIIVAFALVVFGPKKLPELSRTVGKALAEFRRATKEFSDELSSAVEEESTVGGEAQGETEVRRPPLPGPKPGPKPGPTSDSKPESHGRSN